MPFFDKLEETFSTLEAKGRSVTQWAKDFTETNKLTSQISASEETLRIAYQAIGELFFRQTQEAPPEEYQLLFDSVLDASTQLEELRKQVQSLKGICTCTGCGREISLDMAFCPHCGTRNESYCPPSAPTQECAEPQAPESAGEAGTAPSEEPQPTQEDNN